MARRPLLALLALPLVLALAACAPATSVGGPDAPPDDGQPTQEQEQDPGVDVPADAVLSMAATVTADNSAVLDVTLVVRTSTAWDDPAAADRPALMTSVCAGTVDESLFADQLYSFAAVDVTATARSGAAWPADHLISVFPATYALSVASEGFPIEDPAADPASPHCKRDKYLDGPGAGTMVVAFRGDTDDAGAAGGFTRWANHIYGLAVTRLSGGIPEDVGMTVSDCTYEVTDLGAEFHGGADWWLTESDDVRCLVGNIGSEDEDS